MISIKLSKDINFRIIVRILKKDSRACSFSLNFFFYRHRIMFMILLRSDDFCKYLESQNTETVDSFWLEMLSSTRIKNTFYFKFQTRTLISYFSMILAGWWWQLTLGFCQSWAECAWSCCYEVFGCYYCCFGLSFSYSCKRSPRPLDAR